MTARSTRLEFRELLRPGGAAVLPGVANALAARVVADLGFPAAYITGAGVANTYLGNGGNLDLGVNIVNWLTGDDRLIAIQPRSAADANLTLSRTWLAGLVIVFLIALPLAFITTGAWIWWRRRNA